MISVMTKVELELEMNNILSINPMVKLTEECLDKDQIIKDKE